MSAVMSEIKWGREAWIKMSFFLLLSLWAISNKMAERLSSVRCREHHAEPYRKNDTNLFPSRLLIVLQTNPSALDALPFSKSSYRFWGERQDRSGRSKIALLHFPPCRTTAFIFDKIVHHFSETWRFPSNYSRDRAEYDFEGSEVWKWVQAIRSNPELNYWWCRDGMRAAATLLNIL